jgi:histidyl-tRNA synthetase
VPVFEDLELFKRTSGETSDIVSKEMYEFRDKGDRDLALRPEFTAGVMRALIEGGALATGAAYRVAYNGPCFRYGRPGKGRYRQLHQFGFEHVGTASHFSDAEIMQVVLAMMIGLGLEVELRINSIGSSETRQNYGEIILSHLKSWLADQDSEAQAKAAKNPFRLLDTKDKDLRANLEGLPSILDHLDEASGTRWTQLLATLDEYEVPFIVDPAIVRGLDYYNDTVFEVTCPDLGENISLCGGGRYDGLIALLGGTPTPSVGAGIGIERLILAVASAKTFEPSGPPIIYIVTDAESRRLANKLAQSLRLRSFGEIILDADGRTQKHQLKQADRVGAAFAVILNEKEVRDSFCIVKHLQTGEQQTVPLDEVVDVFTLMEEDFDEMEEAHREGLDYGDGIFTRN